MLLKKKSICLLWLFLAIVAFFSCCNIYDPVDTQFNPDIANAPKNHLTMSFYFVQDTDRQVTECMVGDTICLRCNVPWYYPIMHLTAIITTSNKWDEKRVELFEPYGTSYLQVIPHPPRPYIAYISPLKEEILTAEVEIQDIILKTTLNVRSK